MNKLLIIVTTCCISIILCACGESVPVVENSSVETIREEDTTFEQVSDEDEEPVLWDNSDPEQWKQVYLNYLDTLKGADLYVYSLIYVDDDDIPELVIDSGFDGGYMILDGGCKGILTYHGNVLDEYKPIFSSRFTYIERRNLINNTTSHSDNVCTIQNGKWVYVGGGYHCERVRGWLQKVVHEYSWDEVDVDEEDYYAQLNAIYPEGQGMYPQKYYFLEDICSIIKTGDVASAGHRYELVVEDVTWEEAFAYCQEKGGYLATITSEEEMKQIQAQVLSEKKTDITFFVGAKDKKWLEYGTEEKNVLLLYTVLDFWPEDGLKLGWRDEEDGKDYFALMYRQSDKRCYLNEVANDILEETPSDTGKVGYICEYDS